MDRIDELRQLALDIANEIGLDSADLLQNEVNLLSQRLSNVRESIDVLAGIAEARNSNDTACNENIAVIVGNLKDMQEVRIPIRRKDFSPKIEKIVIHFTFIRMA